MTFGFQTAVQIVTDAIDRLHTTAESHNRVMVVEVMGRHAGWIATHAGIAGGADAILVPERPFDIDEVVRAPPPPPRPRAQLLDRRRRRGCDTARGHSAASAPRRRPTHSATLGWAGSACRSRRRSSGARASRARVTILGHVQRGGTPVAFDRVLATRFGVAAMDAASGGRYRTMVALRGTDIIEVPLADALRQPKLLDPSLYETAELFFG